METNADELIEQKKEYIDEIVKIVHDQPYNVAVSTTQPRASGSWFSPSVSVHLLGKGRWLTARTWPIRYLFRQWPVDGGS